MIAVKFRRKVSIRRTSTVVYRIGLVASTSGDWGGHDVDMVAQLHELIVEAGGSSGRK